MNALIVAAMISAQSNLPLSVDQLEYATKKVQRETDLLIGEAMLQLYRNGQQAMVTQKSWRGNAWLDFANTSHEQNETVSEGRALLHYIEDPRNKKSPTQKELARFHMAQLLKRQQEAELKDLYLMAEDKLQKLNPGVENEAKRAKLQQEMTEIEKGIRSLKADSWTKSRQIPAAGWLGNALNAICAHFEMCAIRDDLKHEVERLEKEQSVN